MGKILRCQKKVLIVKNWSEKFQTQVKNSGSQKMEEKDLKRKKKILKVKKPLGNKSWMSEKRSGI